MRCRYVLISLVAWLVCAAPLAAAPRPNFVVILADDYGWGSLGCYGAKDLKTPNLDRLAQEGRRFTQAYAPGSVCSTCSAYRRARFTVSGVDCGGWISSSGNGEASPRLGDRR